MVTGTAGISSSTCSSRQLIKQEKEYGMKLQRHYGTRRNLVRVLMFTAAVFTLAIQASAAPRAGACHGKRP